MKLSIITITYNAEKVIERTLMSIFKQTNLSFEYIIIDGASTDKTLDIAKKYKVKNVYSEPDKGIYDAMNKGLSKASGDYIWFMNAGDEIYDEHVVENLIDLMQSNADIYYSDTMIVDENNNNLGLRSEITPHKLPKTLHWQDFKYGMVVCHQSFIAKKSTCKPFLLNHHFSSDIDWEIKCLKAANTIEFVPFVLSKYLAGGFSIKNLKASLFDRFLVLKNHFGWYGTVIAHLLIILRGISFTMKFKGKYW
jgi:glycosyltransferase involved in cell wall biosynthesis